MELEITDKAKKYFKTRTPGGNGAIRDLIVRPPLTKDSINVGDNDYLCIAKAVAVTNHDSEVVMSSAFISDDGPQGLFQKQLAEYMGKEASMIAQSGYAANAGLIQGFCNSKTNVYIDNLLHGSFRDGLGFVRPKTHIFKHNDVNELEEMIRKNGHGIIIVESLYSVTGDFAPIKDIISIKKKYGCFLVVDESHGIGLYGHKGRGYSSLFDYKEVNIVTASLAKAFCARAGVIAGDKLLIDYAREHSMPNIFSTCIMNYDLIRMHKILHRIIDMDKEREHLLNISKEFRNSLERCGANYTKSDIPSPIVSLVFPSEKSMVKMNKYLLEKNVFASCFIYPTTPINAPCLRFTLNSDITMKDINYIMSQITSYNGSKL
ncbi:PLP-dependent transferase [Neoconidiobolus thromboides FSU 785]|nr:PLP-dependent transferase [Neoconidiobolus thromboides FSU 785]